MEYTAVTYCGVACSTRQHFIKFWKVFDFGFMDAGDFVDLWCHARWDVEQRCCVVCPGKENCHLHNCFNIIDRHYKLILNDLIDGFYDENKKFYRFSQRIEVRQCAGKYAFNGWKFQPRKYLDCNNLSYSQRLRLLN